MLIILYKNEVAR